MLNFCDFIQVYVFTTNHHLNCIIIYMCVLSFDTICIFSELVWISKSYI